jgi:hypothetical protein
MTKFIVTKAAMRPGKPGQKKCFYCNQDIGMFHKEDCVLVKKKVKIRAIIEYEISVPAAWNKHDIEFQRNEGSWCASNMIGELQEIEDDETQGCLCGITEFQYIEDTTEAFLEEK